MLQTMDTPTQGNATLAVDSSVQHSINKPNTRQEDSHHHHGTTPSEHTTAGISRSRVIFTSSAGAALVAGTATPSMITLIDEQESTGERIFRIDRLLTPDRGRVMVAASFIPKGTLLYQAVPQAAICDAENRQKRCGSCLASLLKIDSGDNPVDGTARKYDERGASMHCVGCVGCGEIWYCDEECRVRDWNAIHELECGFLKGLYRAHGQETTQESNNGIQLGEQHQRAVDRYKALDSYDQDYCRVLLRVLVIRFKEYLLWTGAVDKDHTRHELQKLKPLPFVDVFDLVENRECFSRDKLEGDMTDVARILDAMQEYLDQNHSKGHWQRQGQLQGQGLKDGQDSVPRLTMDELLGLILKEECNSFGLYEYQTPTAASSSSSSRASYGLGLFVRGYIHSYNHSCAHNVYHVAHGSQLLFFAARDIQPGEELNITYMEFGPKHRIPGNHDQPWGLEQEQERRAAFEKRRAYLKEIFHFDCGCPRCLWDLSLDQQQQQQSSDGIAPSKDGRRPEEERFIKEGLLCGRAGCYGFYVPPEVSDIIRGERSGLREMVSWECVACGHQQEQ